MCLFWQTKPLLLTCKVLCNLYHEIASVLILILGMVLPRRQMLHEWLRDWGLFSLGYTLPQTALPTRSVRKPMLFFPTSSKRKWLRYYWWNQKKILAQGGTCLWNAQSVFVMLKNRRISIWEWGISWHACCWLNSAKLCPNLTGD